MTGKKDLIRSLPIMDSDDTIRPWQRADLDRLSRWPSYPFPYESFNYRFSAMSTLEKDSHYQKREDNPDRITLVLDHADQKAVGYLALVEIDWHMPHVGNMAVRLSPDWCNKGIGTQLLQLASGWCFVQGIVSLRLNVAASNQRAVRCYEKAGYHITGEFWQNDESLGIGDLDRPEFDFLRPHVRKDGSVPQLRFYWMEIMNPDSAALNNINR
jgi:RimJ/RimL family protein N-acetyltransferase